MTELFQQNPSVVFFMIGGVCTVAAMLVGVLLIRKKEKTYITVASKPSSKPVYKKKNNK